MPSADQTMHALMSFLHARNWADSRRVLDAHPELVNVGPELIDVMLNNPAMTELAYRGVGQADAEKLLRAHQTVLARCKQVGVSRAFAELPQ